MPCGSSGGSSDEMTVFSYGEFERLKKELDSVTAMLCQLCAVLENTAPGIIGNNPALVEWFVKHKEWDLKRENKNEP